MLTLPSVMLKRIRCISEHLVLRCVLFFCLAGSCRRTWTLHRPRLHCCLHRPSVLHVDIHTELLFPYCKHFSLVTVRKVQDVFQPKQLPAFVQDASLSWQTPVRNMEPSQSVNPLVVFLSGT